MSDWWANSPFYTIGFYFGGSNLGSCFVPSQSWLNTVNNQGWSFLPLWSGDQDPCWNGSGAKFSINTSTAYTQGQGAANSAKNAAQSLGFLSGANIYFDLEGYDYPGDPATQACKDAANAFFHGWDQQLAADGYTPGVYGSSASSFLDNLYHLTYNPTVGWGATGNGNNSVWTLPQLPNSDWVDDHRFNQYKENVTPTYGVTSLLIDRDCSLGGSDMANPAYAESTLFDTGSTNESNGTSEDATCQS